MFVCVLHVLSVHSSVYEETGEATRKGTSKVEVGRILWSIGEGLKEEI